MTTAQIDASFDLPYTRLPHPRYKGKTIPAWDMIKHSINMHRGCFGGVRSAQYQLIRENLLRREAGIDSTGGRSGDAYG